MLKVNELFIQFDDSDTPTVKNLNFSVEDGEIMGLVGESGSGKTLTSLCLAGILPANAVCSGEMDLDGVNFLALSRDEKRKYLGNTISMIFQEPMTSLNPVFKVGHQLGEMLKLHPEKAWEKYCQFKNLSDEEAKTYRKLTKAERKELVMQAFCEVDLGEVENIYYKYPHELSGGMQQRVMIAMALMCNPKILIADEPTTALDVVVQEQILGLLKKLNKEKNTTIIFISHDLKVVRKLCKNICVMQKGEIVEAGDVEEIFANPKHPYTKKLIESSILKEKEVTENKEDLALEVKDLSVFYMKKGNGFFEKAEKKSVIENLSFDIKKGEIVGLVGKSGRGKSTISKAILGLHSDYTGDIIHYTKKPQMVFQDTLGSINPAKKIGWILEEPLKINGVKNKKERMEKVYEMLDKVGIPRELINRTPRGLSGGQRQRVNIALALILGSEFIIADEPVSALDVTVQAQILELLLGLQKEYNLSILFISHDMEVIKSVCDRVIEL